MTQAQIILLMLILGGIASLQFFKGRKVNTLMMIKYIRDFEESLKPKDKLYTYIGGYIGFKANYDINENFIKKIELTLTLLPRQSLLYLPISYLTRKHDRLYVVIRLNEKFGYDSHIIKKRFYFPGPIIDNIETFRKEDIVLNGKEFYALYKNRSDLERLMKLVENSISIEDLRHIAYTRETNVLFLLLKPNLEKTAKDLKNLTKELTNLLKVM
ncbi:MAG: hypothetical protein QMD25_06465 [Caldisericia bacterium]|jgi:hypothetical protein|nr:hypothetical protein [Caldisericia bacterium]